MNNIQDITFRKFLGFTLAAVIGVSVTGVSYSIGWKVGFGSFLPNDESFNSVVGYENVMRAFLRSAIWQINAYMVILLTAKWFIYQDKSKKLWYSLLIYWLMPFVVWVSLEEPLRALAFSLIAAMSVYEGLFHRWVENSSFRKK